MSDSAAPDSIIPELFGADVLQSCAIIVGVDPRLWIAGFIEAWIMFRMTERGSSPVRSVTLIHRRFGEAWPIRQTTDPLGQARRSDVPTPDSAFVKQWSRNQRQNTLTESTFAKLLVFENTKTAKKLVQ
ncbi:hypothetical protein AAVH_18614 [Aphelenchoides avenae]|nr:hypothetical protein AAVH_18614 [Aphelenchus avenae]